MHEFSVMNQIVESVLREAEKRDAIEVKEVILEIGELTFLGVEQLRFGFEVLTKENLLAGARLTIDETKAEIECACGYHGGMNYSETPHFHRIFPIISCPECGGAPTIVKGKDCVVRNIIMEV